MKLDQMVELLRSAASSGSMDIVQDNPIFQVIYSHIKQFADQYSEEQHELMLQC